MKVLIVGNLRLRYEHSMLGFADRLAQEDFSVHNVQVDLICPEPLALADKIRSPRARKYFNYLQTYLIFPQKLKRVAKSVDLVHITDQGSSHWLKATGKTPSIITVHDLLAVRASLGQLSYWSMGESGKAQQKIILQSLPFASRAACVSHKTQSDLVGLAPQLKSEVIANAAFNSAAEAVGERQKHFHSIGGNQPYKNRAGNVRIASELLQRSEFHDWTYRLLGRPPDEQTQQAIDESSVRDRIHVLADPSHEEVAHTYKTSQGLLFFSHDEGFGLPILEAQSGGCLVCTRAADPMSSVAGGGAIKCSAQNPAEIADSIASQWTHREAIIEEGNRNVSQYTMSRMAQQYADLYKETA